MSESPERIWINKVHGQHPEDWNFFYGKHVTKPQQASKVEYVRADRIEELDEALEKEKKAAEKEAYIWSENYAALERKVEQLKEENEKLLKGLEIYERERTRFRHANPERTGAYFLSGGHGETDDNLLPQFVTIVPAYGCAWEQVYEKTDRTISYEGS